MPSGIVAPTRVGSEVDVISAGDLHGVVDVVDDVLPRRLRESAGATSTAAARRSESFMRTIFLRGHQ
jgi:hypothetical protein